MKEQILQVLRGADDFISGEQLCQQFDVSRTAIWKHIKDLQADGYEIEAVRNRGYKLVRVPDLVTSSEILQNLRTRRIGQHVISVQEVDSTNLLAAKLADRGEPDGTLVIAELQTGGKGRRGRSWFSPAGTGIWMSLILRPSLPMAQAPLITLIAAVAVSQALTEITGCMAGIKWPNDILFEGKKCCGILTEMSMESDEINYVILGIGVNVNQQAADFPEEIAARATSLGIVSGSQFRRSEVVQLILERFESVYDRFLAEGSFAPIRELWIKQSITIGKQVSAQTPRGVIQGTAVGLDDMGALMVRDGAGNLQKIYSADILFTP